MFNDADEDDDLDSQVWETIKDTDDECNSFVPCVPRKADRSRITNRESSPQSTTTEHDDNSNQETGNSAEQRENKDKTETATK